MSPHFYIRNLKLNNLLNFTSLYILVEFVSQPPGLHILQSMIFFSSLTLPKASSTQHQPCEQLLFLSARGSSGSFFNGCVFPSLNYFLARELCGIIQITLNSSGVYEGQEWGSLSSFHILINMSSFCFTLNYVNL